MHTSIGLGSKKPVQSWIFNQYYLQHRCLQENQMGGDEYINKMDQQLPEATILLFRRLAHAKVMNIATFVVGFVDSTANGLMAGHDVALA